VIRVQPCPLPADALLARYVATGAYTDCYAAELAHRVSQAEYVEAFYTGGLFKLERWLLSLLLSRPSTDAQARQLAGAQASSFAAWRVEDRTDDQLLLCAIGGRTRSWLMVSTRQDAKQGTRLYFGSAVMPVIERSTGKRSMGFLFKALLGFHKAYSRALLASARSRLARRASPAGG
jgi:hypothetical protein